MERVRRSGELLGAGSCSGSEHQVWWERKVYYSDSAARRTAATAAAAATAATAAAAATAASAATAAAAAARATASAATMADEDNGA
jgi:hypothetical protein